MKFKAMKLFQAYSLYYDEGDTETELYIPILYTQKNGKNCLLILEIYYNLENYDDCDISATYRYREDFIDDNLDELKKIKLTQDMKKIIITLLFNLEIRYIS